MDTCTPQWLELNWVSVEVNLGGHAPVLVMAELEDQGSTVLNPHSQIWE